eukprot:gene34627-48280_t
MTRGSVRGDLGGGADNEAFLVDEARERAARLAPWTPHDDPDAGAGTAVHGADEGGPVGDQGAELFASFIRADEGLHEWWRAARSLVNWAASPDGAHILDGRCAVAVHLSTAPGGGGAGVVARMWAGEEG